MAADPPSLTVTLKTCRCGSGACGAAGGPAAVIPYHRAAVFMVVLFRGSEVLTHRSFNQHYITDNSSACQRRGRGGGSALCPQRQRPSPALIERMLQHRDTPPKKTCAFAPDVTGTGPSQRRQRGRGQRGRSQHHGRAAPLFVVRS